MESIRATRSVKSEPAPRVLGFSTEPTTPTPGTRTEGGDEHATSAAYLLKWSDTDIAKITLHSAAQLRSCMQEDSNSNRRLLVFRGLPVSYGVAVKEATDIDAPFIDAHAGRRSYRPLRTKGKAAWAHYDYPELVHQHSILNSIQRRPTSGDLVGDAPTYAASATGDSIMLCRASIWLSEKAQVLFLDRAPWEDPRSEVSRGRYTAYTPESMPDDNGVSTVTMQMDADGNMTTLGDEIPSLEMMLYDSLRDGRPENEDLLELLEELVINKWEDFFEALGLLDFPFGSPETAALFSQALGCLERNLDVSRRWRKTRRQCADAGPPETHPLVDAKLRSATTEWEMLLSRLGRRAQLLSHLAPVVAKCGITRKPSADAGFGIVSTGGRGEKHECRSGNNNNISGGGRYYNSNGTPSTPDENQRALNRVAYLGGVLLPFSVVSGILAIEDPYGPGGPQFWIFWAVTVPLTLVTLGVIYADSIRKVQVWVEVAASSSSGKSGGSDTDTDSVSPPLRTDVEQGVPVTSRIAQPVTFTENFVDVDDGNSGHGHEDGDADADADGEGEGEGEPDMIVEKRWKNAPAYQGGDAGRYDDDWARKKKMKWRKEELGWVGACATLFQVYKLKKGVPPKHLRHSDRRDGLPRRARTN
ncbi:hypothetical protein F5Y03DRAFT_290153 [Xylaria venustula]|nr:hypothetical protein F5Y03DRAFT_290153 [Xylaria venustula]